MAKISTTVKQSAKSPKKKFKKKSVAPAERNDSILIIGAGNMGGSLAKGLMRSPLRQMMQIRIYDTSIDRLEKLTNESPVQVVSNLEQDDLADTGHTLNSVINQLRNNYQPISELRSAVLWTKGVSSFTPDYSVEFLPTNPWIHQPFEGYDAMRPEQLIAKWSV